jgi:hypothetical protein
MGETEKTEAIMSSTEDRCRNIVSMIHEIFCAFFQRFDSIDMK